MNATFQDDVLLIPVSHDLGESPSRIQAYFDSNGLPWEPYIGDRTMLSTYQVLSQSSAVAVGRDGVIAFRKGYGSISSDRWDQVLTDLRGS